MSDNRDWFDRFEAKIRNSGRSLRDISIAAGARPGYLHDVFGKQQDPSVSRFISICKAANISPVEILTGVQTTPKMEEVLKIFSSLTDEQQEAFLLLFRKSPCV